MPSIYEIRCLANDRFYIGSALNLRDRWTTHRRMLRLGQHPNPILLAHWNKYGASAFICVERQGVACRDHLLAVEQAYLDWAFRSALCMNVRRSVEGWPNNPPCGVQHFNSVLTEEDVREIHDRLSVGQHASDLAIGFGVSPSQVTGIRQGTAWKHLGLPPLRKGKRKPREANQIGQVYGNLTVVRFHSVSGQKRRWLCRCVCGREVAVTTSNLNSGNSKSCGKGACHGKRPPATARIRFATDTIV